MLNFHTCCNSKAATAREEGGERGREEREREGGERERGREERGREERCVFMLIVAISNITLLSPGCALKKEVQRVVLDILDGVSLLTRALMEEGCAG